MSVVKTLTQDTNFYLGLILAVTASLFTGTSFIIKKKALLIISRKGCVRAGSGGFAYLREWVWWCGLTCMGIGEMLNFTAYTFAPASLVTPLGVLSVLVSAVLSAIFLKEYLNILGKMGSVLCLLGSTIIVIHAPNINTEETYTTILEKLSSISYLIYVSFVIVIVLIIMFHFAPKYGQINLIWNILICSLVGSLMVMSCKSFGVILKQRIDHVDPNFSWFLPLGLFGSVIIGICIQMTYLSRALDLFNTCVVTPVYYVCFTSFVLIASSILFREYSHLSVLDIVGSLSGFSVITIGVVLLNAFKNIDISFNDVKGTMKQKNMTINDISSLGKICLKSDSTHL